ncbi:S-adenosyl-L-methionine-dependent methyltransferase [Apiospora rasikravindrae]|uniref:S-adenosyl-L-methionine-dependent methyltransferase n=1 Tax=Apiospora rasikravindrae TaxID=990691 RepID=A0ABR1SEH4_9PEZI
MSHSNQLINVTSEDNSGQGVGQRFFVGGAAHGLEKMKPFEPGDFLPEDYPEIDPQYLSPDIVSPVALPPSQSGIPQEAWLPAEWYRESSGSSVVEPDSVTEDNGRTYHGYKEGKYFLPNDAAEQDRLDLHHYSSRLMLQGRLYLAPIQSPKRVLDLATGTGIWPMEFGVLLSILIMCATALIVAIAQEHPECQVIGTDLSKIQPEHPPANLQFLRDDAEEPWEFGPERFDFIHARYVCTCFDNPKAVMQQAFENLSPGGWVEYCDSTVDVLSMDGSSQVVDVVERKMAGVVGPWCKSARLKQMGRVTARSFYDNVTGMSYKLFRNAGFAPEQIEEFAARFRADLLNPAIHAYFPV